MVPTDLQAVSCQVMICQRAVCLQELLTHDRVEDLNKAVSLVFAIFHIDLGACFQSHGTTPSHLKFRVGRNSTPTCLHIRDGVVFVLHREPDAVSAAALVAAAAAVGRVASRAAHRPARPQPRQALCHVPQGAAHTADVSYR